MRYIAFWIFAVILYGIGDTATTFLAVRTVNELNPIINFLIDMHPSLFILLKIAVLILLFALSTISLRRGEIRPAYLIPLALSVIGAIATLLNILSLLAWNPEIKVAVSFVFFATGIYIFYRFESIYR